MSKMPVRYITIQHIENNVAYGANDQGVPISIPMALRPYKGPAPAVGEMWMVANDAGMWRFIAMQNPPGPPTVTGTRPDGGSVALLLKALADRGYIIDETTNGDDNTNLEDYTDNSAVGINIVETGSGGIAITDTGGGGMSISTNQGLGLYGAEGVTIETSTNNPVQLISGGSAGVNIGASAGQYIGLYNVPAVQQQSSVGVTSVAGVLTILRNIGICT